MTAPPSASAGVVSVEQAIEAFLLGYWSARTRANYAANTIAGRVSVVSAFYRRCVRQQLCDRNPVR